jgi:hypothetical protein
MRSVENLPFQNSTWEENVQILSVAEVLFGATQEFLRKVGELRWNHWG